jgi:hypothetical protein
VLLENKAAYSSSMALRQDGSARAARTEVGTGESGDDEVADKVSLSLVRPSLAVTAKVEARPVAPVQPEGDASSAGMPEPREARVESRVLCGIRQMSARWTMVGR